MQSDLVKAGNLSAPSVPNSISTNLTSASPESYRIMLELSYLSQTDFNGLYYVIFLFKTCYN